MEMRYWKVTAIGLGQKNKWEIDSYSILNPIKPSSGDVIKVTDGTYWTVAFSKIDYTDMTLRIFVRGA